MIPFAWSERRMAWHRNQREGTSRREDMDNHQRHHDLLETNVTAPLVQPIPICEERMEEVGEYLLDNVAHSMSTNERRLLSECLLPTFRSEGSAGGDDNSKHNPADLSGRTEDNIAFARVANSTITKEPADSKIRSSQDNARRQSDDEEVAERKTGFATIKVDEQSRENSFHLPAHLEHTSSSSHLPAHQNLAAPSANVASQNLDKPKFCNIWNYQQDLWEKNLQKLTEFRKKSGHCRVPHNWKEDASLAAWTKRQRNQFKLYKTGKKSSMTHERQKALESVGFAWHSHQSAWEDRWTELQEFKQLHGHTNVPSNYPDNPSLAIWVKMQRRQLRNFWGGEPSSMTEDRISKLSSLDFEWNPRKLAGTK